MIDRREAARWRSAARAVAWGVLVAGVWGSVAGSAAAFSYTVRLLPPDDPNVAGFLLFWGSVAHQGEELDIGWPEPNAMGVIEVALELPEEALLIAARSYNAAGVESLSSNVLVVDPVHTADTDADGVEDSVDNCQLTPNPSQADVDAGTDDNHSEPGVQHYGDACDLDLNNDGLVTPSDYLSVLRPCIGLEPAVEPACAVADLDQDGLVGGTDAFAWLGGNQHVDTPGPGVTD